MNKQKLKKKKIFNFQCQIKKIINQKSILFKLKNLHLVAQQYLICVPKCFNPGMDVHLKEYLHSSSD